MALLNKTQVIKYLQFLYMKLISKSAFSKALLSTLKEKSLNGMMWISALGIAVAIFEKCAVNKDEKTGEGLSKKYCASCHLYPSPDLLTKQVWERNVLPVMGAIGDMYKDKSGLYRKLSPEMATIFRDKTIADIQLVIPPEDFNKIVDYYIHHAPDTLLYPSPVITLSANSFTVLQPAKRSKSFTGLVYFDEKNKLLFQSGFKDSVVNIFDPALTLLTSITQCGTVVDVVPSSLQGAGGVYYITHIGSFQANRSTRNGFVEKITINNGQVKKRERICDSLNRPVQSLPVDINNDGKEDLLVCEFGFMKGQLSLFINEDGKRYSKQVISTMVGAEKIYVDDINKDGLPDIWALFAHDVEGIFQFINKGNNQFEKKQVMVFPPCYGSTYFELADMDNDGNKDIVYTCGDNADYSPVLKPYHGVYIFKYAHKKYEQAYFFPVNGCYKAMAADLDGDGKKDLAVISFFADYERRPEEGVLWLINDGDNHYSAHADPSIINKGRWISLDVKDINADKKPDIILGNMAAKPGMNTGLMTKWINGPEFSVLLNH